MNLELPLHVLHQAAGAQFADYGSWTLPMHYGDPLREYNAIRQGVALADLSYQGKFILSGEDRKAFLQGLISNDLLKATESSGIYTTLLTAKGKTIADFSLFPLPEGYLMEIEAENAEKTKDVLMRFRLRSKVQMTVPAWGRLLVAGPLAKTRIEQLFGDALPKMAEHAFFERAIDEVRLICIKRSVTGEADFHLYTPLENVEGLWTRLLSEGAGLPLQPVGQTALKTTRIEAGIPRYGVDMNEEVIPVEAGIQDQVISYTKGCFPGQEVVARIKTYGHVNKQLSGIILEGDIPPQSGAKISQGEKSVGWVTSAVKSPFVGKVIAMAYLRRKTAVSGTALTVDVAQAQTGAEAASLPFYPLRFNE